MKRYLAVIAATAILTFAATAYLLRANPAPDPVVPMQVTPRWIDASACAAMTSDERARDELAIKVLREIADGGWMRIGAVRDLGRDRYRAAGNASALLCHAADLNGEIAELTLAQRLFTPSHLHADEVRLARRLGPRDQRIVEAVARTAFNNHPIVTQYPELRADIRSLARVTLAEFGPAAAPWAVQAFDVMSSKDALGTSAAQIAVAAKHPEALGKVAGLLSAILDDQSKDPIQHAARDRFYELAYALAAAGPEARPHVQSVIRIMGRKVQSWAPPFGMVELAPRRMCRVLELIGGPEADRARVQEVCHPKIDVYEK